MSISRNSLFLFTSQVISLVLGILVSIIVSRVLGPANRGVYFLVLAINYMIINISNFGVGISNIYLLSKEKRTLGEVNSSSMILAALIGLFFISLYLLSHNLLHEYLLKGIGSLYTMLAFCLVPLALYSKYWEDMMSGLNKFELLSKFNIISVVIRAFSIFIVLLILKLGIHGLIGWWVVSTFIFTMARIYLLNRQERLFFSFDIKLLKQILSFGFKGHIGNVAWALDNRLGMFIVNYFMGTTGVGHFSLSASLAEKIWFLPTSLKTTSSPIIGGLKKDKAGELTARVNRHTLWLKITTAVLIAMVAPWGIPLFYGAEYAPSVMPLLILLPGMVLGRSIFSSYITLQLGKPHIPSIVTWINTIIHIALAFIMIKTYGIVGAAMATAIFYTLQFVFLFLIFNAESKLSFSEIFVLRRADISEYRQLVLKIFQRCIFLVQKNIVRAKSSVNIKVNRP